MKYVYIVNRFNLKEKTDELISRLRTVSEEFNREYEIRVNETVEEALKMKDDYRNTEHIITAIGGDGSVNLVLNDIVGTKNILSFIPYGTGNDFYRTCEETLKDGIHDVDIIRINDRYFINVACFGIDADIANDEHYIHNRFIPKSMRYNAGVVHHFLTYSSRKMKVEFNDETVDKQFTTVVVANSRYFGNGYRVSPLSYMDDGKMELLLADKLNKASMANVILSMKNAGHLKNPAVRMACADKITISSDIPFKANIDGEPLLADHFEITMVPKGIRLEFNKEFAKRFK